MYWIGFHCTRHSVGPSCCQEMWKENNPWVLQNVTPALLNQVCIRQELQSTCTWNVTFHNNCRVVSGLLVRCDEWPAAVSPEVQVCRNWHHWSCRGTSISWQLQNLRLPYQISVTIFFTVDTFLWLTVFLYGYSGCCHGSFICFSQNLRLNLATSSHPPQPHYLLHSLNDYGTLLP